MPLTLVTTAGSASANAYCDLAYVNALADEMFPPPTSWLTQPTDDLKNRAIVAATRLIDRERLVGSRVDSTQALAYPRSGILNAAALDYESETAIPERVKRATATLAIELLRLWERAGAGEAQVNGPSENAGLSSFSLGGEFSASLEPGAGRETPLRRFLAQNIRPILGALVLSPSAHVVRG